ncbi:hypothetical protein ACO22_06578 [Paracoccidioides brasiliensis]|uniref:Inactive metallocarboxypeptidase ECM14 n=1 Tax=Paracoccidioides brasiliensis TaxID=121759 RepID=A0A1D2J748_PARBR|nr:hypothetical protein ACO22_06578 [Paracoccidioides brasiliensis]
MRLFAHLAVLAILACAVPITAIPSFLSNSYPAHPAEGISLFPQTQPQAPLGLWTRLRNTVIERLWRVPPQLCKNRPGHKGKFPLFSAPASLRARYGDDVVLRFTIRNAEEVKALAEASNILFLDVWASTDEWVDIRLSKDVVPSLLGLLPKSLQTSHIPLIHDLPQTIYESYPSSSQRSSYDVQGFSPSTKHSSDKTNIFFQDYQPFSVIVPWMRLLTSMFSSHVQMINIGSTFEGRDIPALQIGVWPANNPKPRKTVVVSGGSHAREWISVSTVNYVAYSLITNYAKSKHVAELLQQFDFIFIPTLNPDGYIYTWEVDRIWRKNRQDTSLPFCPGVDLDRTWGFKWDGNITADNPCSESYPGEDPFAGIEAKQFSQWAKNQTAQNNTEFVAFIDLHSYSQQIRYPYSYSCQPDPPNLENLEELAIGIAKAIRLTNRETYEVSSACEGLMASQAKVKSDDPFPRIERTGGSALDWFYHDLNVKYSYQIKLRDRGSYGFLLPRENIVPTGQEMFNAVMVLGRFLSGHDGFGPLDWEDESQRPKADEDDIPSENELDENDDSWIPYDYRNHDDQNEGEGYDNDEWGFRRRRKR